MTKDLLHIEILDQSRWSPCGVGANRSTIFRYQGRFDRSKYPVKIASETTFKLGATSIRFFKNSLCCAKPALGCFTLSPPIEKSATGFSLMRAAISAAYNPATEIHLPPYKGDPMTKAS